MTELEQLRDRVEQLEGALGMKVSLPALGLTSIKAQITGLLLKREIVSRELILDAVWAGRDEPDPKTVEVHLVKIRRMLALHGVSVKNRFGIGWYIPAEEKPKLKSLMEAT